ncbi:prepilin-type N-terminal cleavage/methylation domain-containing protein [uncultured Paraglaciecola sp.]
MTLIELMVVVIITGVVGNTDISIF